MDFSHRVTAEPASLFHHVSMEDRNDAVLAAPVFCRDSMLVDKFIDLE